MDSHEVNDDYEDYQQLNEQSNDETNNTIRLQLSQTPFEELLKMKDKLGTKVYKETIVDKLSTNNDNNDKNNRFKNKTFKRLNKNRPQEISSKKRVSEQKQVFEMKKKSVENERRDPRFDPQCGQFNETVFKQTFGFLNHIRDKEMNELKKMLKKSKNESKRKELKYLLQRLQNQRLAEQEKQNKKQIETNIRHTLKKENPDKQNFVNKSTLKRLELVHNFKRLKKSGKLDQYLQKKRKRNATRERKKMPSNI